MVESDSYRDPGFEENSEKRRILPPSEADIPSLRHENSTTVEMSSSQSSVKVPSRMRSVLVLVSCFYLLMASFGLNPAFSIIYVELIEVFQSSRAVAALVLSFYNGLTLGGRVLMSRLIARYDVGVCIMIASICVFVSMANASLAPNIGAVIVLMGVLPGLCASVNVLCAFSLVSWFFVNSRKSALSALTVGNSLGQIFIPYVATGFIQAYNWNGCIMLLSALFVFNCVPCGLIIYMSRDYYTKPSVNVNKTPKSSVRNILSDRAFMLYLFTLCLTVLFGPVEQWFIADLTVMKGFGVDAGAVLLSVNGALGLVSKIISSITFKLFPTTRAEIHMTYSYIFWGISHLTIVISPVYWGMVLSIILRGYFAGISYACVPNLRLELRGVELFQQTVAISNLVSGVNTVFGGTLGGYITDVTGSYNMIFYIAAASCIVCFVNMLIINNMLKRRRQSNTYEKL